ncbi:sulfotransferase family protein [Salirhabdus salicampi]|uniref:sulfotransferase family protein n=1 Tax=Salirhabdus salicampi TaxID=476102 RepID=UPI0020C4F9C4|nr:sulfotransferase [Salirhabdus salicampi]MCP8617493.1 sulfotransferase [Salirhabdus salicampi]
MKRIARSIIHLPRNCKRFYLHKTSTVNPSPTFVLGNQKSGTSAIGALLAQLTDRSVAIDLPGICEPVQPKLHRGDLSFQKFVQKNAYDFSKDIIKEPSLTFLYDELRTHFPNAKVVFIIRDPRDNIRSILNRVGIPGHLHNITDRKWRRQLKKAPKDWERVIDSRWMGVKGENYIEWMAHRWNVAADIYTQNKDDMMFIRYEDFVKDKERAIRQLANELDLPHVHDISDKVDIQYQPAGNRNVKKHEFFGEHNLTRIHRICGDRMASFGYKVHV